MKIEKATFGKFKLRDCSNCKTIYEYQVASIQVDGVNIFLCDKCLEELFNKIDEYLDDKYSIK